jgi:hypothetical protein
MFCRKKKLVKIVAGALEILEKGVGGGLRGWYSGPELIVKLEIHKRPFPRGCWWAGVGGGWGRCNPHILCPHCHHFTVSYSPFAFFHLSLFFYSLEFYKNWKCLILPNFKNSSVVSVCGWINWDNNPFIRDCMEWEEGEGYHSQMLI